MAEPWAPVHDVPMHLGGEKDSVYSEIGAKVLPSHKLGSLWAFQLSEVDAWVRRGDSTDQEGAASGAMPSLMESLKGQ